MTITETQNVPERKRGRKISPEVLEIMQAVEKLPTGRALRIEPDERMSAKKIYQRLVQHKKRNNLDNIRIHYTEEACYVTKTS